MDKHNMLSLQDTQRVYLELMKEFDKICKENSLRYDLCGGTLLGAVRHGGFIPWDNDIDVAMPRPDFEKLMKLDMNNKISLPPERELISLINGKFLRQFGRYIRKDVAKEEGMKDGSDCRFLGIDIFIVDGMPAGDNALKAQSFRVKQMRRFLHTSLERKGTSRKGKAAAFVKDLYRPLLKAVGSKKIAERLDKICRKYPFDSSEYVGCVNGMYGIKERWKKEEMLPQADYKFEDCVFKSYANYKIYLGNLYGDFMKLPPEDKRVPHGSEHYWVNEAKNVEEES